MKNSSVENMKNEPFLSDWMSGRMSDDQLKLLVSEADFLAYQQLKMMLSNLQVPEPDMDSNYAAIQQKLEGKRQEKASKSTPLYGYFTAAAAVLLFFGLYHFFVFSNSISTGYGGTTKLTLSDHSQVTLNARSSLSYPSLFRWHRSLKLEGEAFFEVAKGSVFSVETTQGSVQVLGTKFKVLARPDFFEVTCYEGKVKVCMPSKTMVLLPKTTVRSYQNTLETLEESEVAQPQWITGESTFKKLPLYLVLDEFENQYNCKLKYPKELASVPFSGSFPHHNIEVALQAICIPLQLKYVKINSTKIIISE